MKNILIIYPHFPPSNLAGVHRPRLFAQHLPCFGWEPIILTVHEKFYEEKLDWNLVKLLPPNLRVIKTSAFNLTKPRIIGDLGLRALTHLYKKAKHIIKTEKIDFLYIPIPSFYCALLGRWLHETTNVRYGIDYIDPWVHRFPGSETLFSRHWLSSKLAGFLESVAVKKACLITGVAEGYYEPVLERNPHLKARAVHGAMPYGGEIDDHELLRQLKPTALLFSKSIKIKMVYAGAVLPKSFELLDAVFKKLSDNRGFYDDVEFYFIGTGKNNDGSHYAVKPIAERYSLWQTNVYEYPNRIPYLDVLAHLDKADGIFILGSTEAHYTPSKSYQGVLSGKPIFALLHQASSAVQVIRKSQAGIVLEFSTEDALNRIEDEFEASFGEYLRFRKDFQANQVNLSAFDAYSAKNVTKKLASLLDLALLK